MKNLKNIFVLLIVLLVSSCLFGEKSVAELNPEFEDNMVQALKTYNDTANVFAKRPKPLALFHFADLHGDAVELKRYADFLNKYEQYFDDAVCTGDFVEEGYESDFSFWEKTKGAEKILLTIGNHDPHLGVDGVWTENATEKQMYDRYFAPFLKNTNIIIQEGKTYFYKDYKEKGFRIIALDSVLKDEAEKEQFEWFKKVLTDAKVKDYAVVMLHHFPLWNRAFTTIKCNWSDLSKTDAYWFDEIWKYQGEIQRFMDDGGEFVCWLGGHTHYDMIGYNIDTPKQLNIIISAASRYQGQYYDDHARIDNMRCQDLANAVVVDRYSHTVKLIRIGANLSNFMQPRNVLCMNYKTFEIYSQF